MTGHPRFALLALASLLLLQLAAAQIDPAVCAESCRFVVVPSLGPAGPTLDLLWSAYRPETAGWVGP